MRHQTTHLWFIELPDYFTRLFYQHVSARSVKSTLGPVSTKRQHQCCNDACDSVLIENNGVTPRMDLQPIFKQFTIFNENRIASVIPTLMLRLDVNGPLCEMLGEIEPPKQTVSCLDILFI